MKYIAILEDEHIVRIGDKPCLHCFNGLMNDYFIPVKERKVGKWVYTPTKRLVDETDEGAIYDTQLKCNCSVCGADFGYRKMEDKYCKFCGSEMVGTENG